MDSLGKLMLIVTALGIILKEAGLAQTTHIAGADTVGRLLLLSVGSCLLIGCAKTSEVSTATIIDPRLETLFTTCGPEGDRYYDRNTSEPVKLLVEKLNVGQLEVLRRSREELGRLGDAAVEALAHEVDRYYASPIHAPQVRNALTALGLNRSAKARVVILRGLDHPKETISQAALSGLLLNHVRPEDFDRFLAHINSPRPTVTKRAFVRALYLADPARSYELFAEWFAQGTYRGLWSMAAPQIALAKDPRVAELALAHATELPPELEPYLVAAAAGLGNEVALERMRELLRDPRLERRTASVLAVTKAGLSQELLGLVLGEGNPELRIILLDEIARSDLDADVIDAELTEALEDPGQRVRNFALKLAVQRGSSAGVARAHAALEQDVGMLQAAFDAFHARFSTQPAPAHLDEEVDAVRTRLIARVERESSLTLADRAALLKGIGLCPGEESARFLRKLGLAFGDERIEGLRAHRWLLIQAANSGPAGLDFLARELDSEIDVSRRLDIIDACGSTREEHARERLLHIAEAAGTTSAERLMTAKVLVRLGHTEEVSSRLKRVLYAMEPSDPARRPLQCLMWLWF